MKLEINKEQFRELLQGAMLYYYFFGDKAERDDDDFRKYEKIQKYLLQFAKENKLKEFYQDFEGHLLPSDDLMHEEEDLIHNFEDDCFWHELTTRLGQRDFYRTINEDEKAQIEKEKWLPKRIHEIYQKYDKEFEENGTDRLIIE